MIDFEVLVFLYIQFFSLWMRLMLHCLWISSYANKCIFLVLIYNHLICVFLTFVSTFHVGFFNFSFQ